MNVRKENGEEYVGRFKGGEEKEKCNSIVISKINNKMKLSLAILNMNKVDFKARAVIKIRRTVIQQ